MTRLAICSVAFLASIAAAHAESPREELKASVEKLQKTPTDSALRERVIKLAQELKPVPALPEEALRREGRGKFAFKNAKSNDEYLAAAKEYEEAVRVAPSPTLIEQMMIGAVGESLAFRRRHEAAADVVTSGKCDIAAA